MDDKIATAAYEKARATKQIELYKEIESLREENKGLAEEVAYLVDHYRNGIENDADRNEYRCIWTQRQIDNAKEGAENMFRKLRWGKA